MRILTLFLFLFFSFSSFSQELDLSTEAIPEDMVSNANAVVREHQMNVKLPSKRKMEVRYKRVVTILNEKGNEHINTFIGYNKSINVKNAYAEVYDKTGNLIKKIRKKDFLDVSAVDGGTLYSDSRVLFMNYLPISYPYTVIFTYELETENTGNLPSWRFVEDFMVSTMQTKYSIDFATPELKPSILEKNFGTYPIVSKTEGNVISYEANNIGAIKDENLRPSLEKILPRLMVSPINFYYEGYQGNINNWKDAGLWMNKNLLKDQDKLEPATIALAKDLVSGIDDALEKAKKIYQYVQENTRYISVQVGIGGLKPISAIEVDRLKYGDCKGLANYTKALLKAVDVDAYYVHVEAGQNKVDFEDDMASFEQGNHVILAIPYNEKYYWIDCTSQIHPFGFLGDFTDDRKVLIMKPDGGEIATTDAYLNEKNHQITQASYALNEEGDLSGNINIKTYGIQYDSHFYLEEQPKEDVEDYYKNYWSNINNLTVERYGFKNDKDSVAFEENVDISASRYSVVSDDRLIFVANTFNNSQYVPRRYRDRKFPLEISRGYLDEDEYTVQLPKGYVVESLPEENHIKTKFGEYAINFEQKDETIIIKRKLFIKAGTYPNSEYGAYRTFRRNIARSDNSKIVLIQKT
ncbi:DUF3857 domain-containing protein [Flagellimonas sp.]|uniref:DUF3857 domain-containing protein n=1 Tax=Flagellimonas sp. TaxID=2058762 RepID=UPI003B5014C6